ncbi:hypothetical protein HW40_09555 [Mannheimia haemolytica]|nr:hypothetical protein HW40_09555 [Mannheimia haemolytica]
MLKSLQAVTFVKKIAKVTACILLITSCDQLICPQSIQSVWVENRQSVWGTDSFCIERKKKIWAEK